jgi:hypothetical protein
VNINLPLKGCSSWGRHHRGPWCPWVFGTTIPPLINKRSDKYSEYASFGEEVINSIKQEIPRVISY